MQDAAYDSLLRAKRVALHAAIGATLERDADVVATRPELLGHHFAQAGAAETAASYFLRAGGQAAANLAMAEAHAHLTRGLALAAEIADAPNRRLRQAELTLALWNVQLAEHGFDSPEYHTTYTEAVRLCRGLGPEQAGASKLLAQALFSNWTYTLHAGKVATSHTLATELLELGRNHPDPQIRVLSATAYAASCFFLGCLQEGSQTFAAALEDRGFEADVAGVAGVGIDVRCVLRALFSCCLACQGFPEQARKQARIGPEKARLLQHLPTIAVTLTSACTTDWLLRDQSALEARSSDVVRLAREQRFEFWLARGRGYAGWVAAANGRFEEGRAMLAEGLAVLSGAGVLLNVPHTRAMLADVHVLMGKPDLALAALDDALGMCARTGEAWVEAELHRRKGELLGADPTAAEACFCKSIDTARSQSAKLFELRASVSLARLWRDQGKRDEAHALLAPIYDWFTEGFDAVDLIEAKALLDELAATVA